MIILVAQLDTNTCRLITAEIFFSRKTFYHFYHTCSVRNTSSTHKFLDFSEFNLGKMFSQQNVLLIFEGKNSDRSIINPEYLKCVFI